MNFRDLMQKTRERRTLPPAPAEAPDADRDARDRLRATLYRRALAEVEDSGSFDPDDEPALRAWLDDLVHDTLREDRRQVVTEVLRRSLAEDLFAELTGAGPLAPLLADEDISDILVIGPDEVWVDRGGRLVPSRVRFSDEAHLTRILDRMVSAHGRRLEEATPFADVRLPDGSRLHAIIPPLSPRGVVVSIRKHRARPFTAEDFVAGGFLSEAARDYLAGVVGDRRNLLVCGGASTGKTTLLNWLGGCIPPGERVVTIEETLEMRLAHPHVVPLESRPANTEGRGEVDLRTLVRNALRMRADRIIVGEVRGAEVFDMLQAMNVGHPGSMTTVHANGVEDAFRRLETLVLLSGLALPGGHLRALLGASFEVVVHLERRADGARQVVRIAEITPREEGWVVHDRFLRAKPEAPLDAVGGSPC
jgi:pilus assembly protein CpaF